MFGFFKKVDKCLLPYNKLLVKSLNDGHEIEYNIESPKKYFKYIEEDGTVVTSRGTQKFYVTKGDIKIRNGSDVKICCINEDGDILTFGKETKIQFKKQGYYDTVTCIYNENVEYILNSNVNNKAKLKLIKEINNHYQKKIIGILEHNESYTPTDIENEMKRANPHYNLIKNLKKTNPEIFI